MTRPIRSNTLLSISIALFLAFVLVNNHVALFISDYYIFLLISIIFALAYIVGYNKVKINIYNITGIASMIIIIAMTDFRILYMDKGVFLSYLVWLIFYILVSTITLSNNNLKIIFSGYIIGAFICAVFVIVFGSIYRWDPSRITIKFGNNVAIDPNYLGLFLLVPNLFLFNHLINKKFNTKEIFKWLMFGVIVFALIRTGSRSSALAFGIGIVIIIVARLRKVKNRRMRYMLTFILAILAFSMTLVAKFSALPYFDRIFNMNLKDTSNTKRFEHWQLGWYTILQKPLLGYGACWTPTVIEATTGRLKDAHNTLLSLLINFGFLGTIFWVGIVIYIFVKLWKNRQLAEMGIFIGYIFANLIIANHLGVSLWINLIIFQNIIVIKNDNKRINIELDGKALQV